MTRAEVVSDNPASKTSIGSAKHRRTLLWGAIFVALVGAAMLFTLNRHREQSMMRSRLFPGTESTHTSEQRARRDPREGDARKGFAVDRADDARIAAIVRGAFQSSALQTNRSILEWIKILKDNAQPLKLRRQAAQAVAREGSPASMGALTEALTNCPPGVCVAIAEALGRCPHPDAVPLLQSLLQDKNEMTACGAVRGIAARDAGDTAAQLAAVLYDNQKPRSVRSEAALSLGTLDRPEALQLLTQAAADLNNEQLVMNVLQGLGERSFAETERFFADYLQSPSLSEPLRVAALEALGQAKGDPGSFLLSFLSHPDSGTRAAAAWAMSTTEVEGSFASQLVDLLGNEQNAEVRTRLYEALGNQEGRDARTVSSLVQNENDVRARLAGLNLLAGMLTEETVPEVLNYFNQTAVPELRDLALKSAAGENSLSSVIVLHRARTPEALRALQQIAESSADSKVSAAAKAALSAPARPQTRR